MQHSSCKPSKFSHLVLPCVTTPAWCLLSSSLTHTLCHTSPHTFPHTFPHNLPHTSHTRPHTRLTHVPYTSQHTSHTLAHTATPPVLPGGGFWANTCVFIGHVCGGLVLTPAAQICRSSNKYAHIIGRIPFQLQLGMCVVPAACSCTWWHAHSRSFCGNIVPPVSHSQACSATARWGTCCTAWRRANTCVLTCCSHKMRAAAAGAAVGAATGKLPFTCWGASQRYGPVGLACFSFWLGAMRRLRASPRRGKWALWLRRRGGVGGKLGGKWSGSFWRATLRVGAAFGGRLMGALREVGWCLAAAKQLHGGYVAGARLLSILAMPPRHPRISHPPSRHPPTHWLATHPLATYPSANQQLAT